MRSQYVWWPLLLDSAHAFHKAEFSRKMYEIIKIIYIFGTEFLTVVHLWLFHFLSFA